MKLKSCWPLIVWMISSMALRCAAAEVGAKPQLWACYYSWYETPQSHGKWAHWTDDQTSNPTPHPKSTAQPLIGYYDSDNAEVVRWHLRLAKASGIDAFLASWWGAGTLSGKVFENVLLPTAASENFKVAILCELAQFHHDLDAVSGQVAEFLNRVRTNSAYLRMDGKPVIYLYQVPFSPKLKPSTFTRLRRVVEAGAGPVYWMMDKVTNENDQGINFPQEWLDISEIQMIGFYGTFSVHRQWDYAHLAPAYARVACQAHAVGKKVFLPTHPGHDNSGFRPDDHFIMPRQDGATLRGYLRAATDAKADVILLTSFNEWPETTIVEPSSSWADPYHYLKILAAWKGVSFVQPPLPPASVTVPKEKPSHREGSVLRTNSL